MTRDEITKIEEVLRQLAHLDPAKMDEAIARLDAIERRVDVVQLRQEYGQAAVQEAQEDIKEIKEDMKILIDRVADNRLESYKYGAIAASVSAMVSGIVSAAGIKIH